MVAHVPELQKVAVRTLSQVTSASACERNWSTFDLIHTKKLNRLHCKRASGLLIRVLTIAAVIAVC